MFLTQEEIQELTGYKRVGAQIKWLRLNGFKFVLGGDGKPRLLLSQIESIIGSTSGAHKRRVEPNFSKFEKVLHGTT